MKTITSEHLLAACAWAESGDRTIASHVRQYDQRRWDCGTTCCLHGAAHLIARGKPASRGPTRDDYNDLPADVRDGVLSVLWSSGGTPDLVRRVIAGDVRIGKGATIGVSAEIGKGVWIGKDAVIGAYAEIGGDAKIGRRAKIGGDTVIGDGAVIGESAVIGKGATIGRDVRIDDGAVIGKDAVIDNAD